MYQSVYEMKDSDILEAGHCAITLGYYGVNDGGAGIYQIIDDITLIDDGGSIHELANGLKAKLLIENGIVNVKQFGARGSGNFSDIDAIKRALLYLSTKGGGILIFPATNNHYVLDKDLSIPKNINLLGEQTRICRYHDHTVGATVFNFQGNNVFEGFIYDGGLTRIPNTGLLNEYIYYTDFNGFNEGVTFKNNTFLNAKGTFIGGLGNCIIINNKFGEFGDHCIYMGGSRNHDGTVKSSEKVIIENNIFTAITSTRDVIKFRNGGEDVIIANNIFDTLQATIFSFSLGDSVNLQADLINFSFRANIIKNCYNLGFIGLNNQPINSMPGIIKNINISDNIIGNCTGYFTIGGTTWQVASNLDYFDGTIVTIRNNYFEKFPFFHATCRGSGLTVIITGNTITGFSRPYMLSFCGNTSLYITDNNIHLPINDNKYLVFSPYQDSSVTVETANILPSTPIKIVFERNIIRSIYNIFTEPDSKNVSILNENIIFIFNKNHIEKNGLNTSFGLKPNHLNLVKSKAIMLDNLYLHDGVIKDINVAYYPKDKLIN